MTLPEPRADLGLRPGYHSAQVEVKVRLNTNESPLPPPEGWVDELTEALRRIAYNRYPDRQATALRRALADLHGVGPDQVFAANGSNEVLQSLCLAYGGAGRHALTFEPTYALHGHISHLTGTGVIEAGRRPDFTIDADDATALIAQHHPALTFLCSPNNPTGLAEDRSTVERIVAAGTGLTVVDEAYGQFARWSAIEALAPDVPLVVTRTFSKTWSMAGVRLGYALGPAPVIRMLERVALPYHLDALKLAAGTLALGHVAEMEERVALLVSERERMIGALAALPVTTWKSEANFVLLRPDTRSGRDVWQGLVDRSVLVRDTSSWPGLVGSLRVTVGTPTENDRFLAALSDVLSGVHA
ncbi:MAG: histidinol-phosphate transaminase [Acidimicrobiales bacterium]